jgi:hypothetical protein
MEVTKRNYVLKANGVYQDGKVYFAGRFPPSHSDFSTTWTPPVNMNRDKKCPVNTTELNEVPMDRRKLFIENLIDKRHHHPLRIEDSKKKAVEGRNQASGGSYFIFMKGGEDELGRECFSVIPIKEWYHFKGVPTNVSFTAEEAEKYISSQATTSLEKAFSFHKQKLQDTEDDIKFKKESVGLDDGEFKIWGSAKTEDMENDHDHLDFDFSDDADVETKEKASTYIKDLTFDTGKISSENKKIWQLAQKEDGIEADEVTDEDEEEELNKLVKSENSTNNPNAAQALPTGVIKKEGSRRGKKRSGEEATYLMQPKKKIVKENDTLPENALAELELENQVRKFFLIRPAVLIRDLLKEFRTLISETQDGNKLFSKVVQRICKKKEGPDGTILVLKDDTRTYH